ncbi:hypothetical protein LZ198_14350 [Myxococcus sp. K15C18031901]|uniref:hypothetical protein n=1 Tax=Myxococcus dinghuensis TaxID=2906761 RepID=UPI0020A81794|nr:hypothetical protein [Myxococcus dinghuensis]MCP3100054.1 hypothetical protein [Myxococcus dinghuensis]
MFLPLLTLGVVLAAKPAPSEKVFVPCQRDTPEWTAARERFTALDARLGTLADDADAEEAFAALQETLASRCFALSREETEQRPKKGVLSSQLAAWWRDGGREWAASYLELGGPGARVVVLPPEVREVLARGQVPEDHRLRTLLCAVEDVDCARETAPWFARLDEAFLPGKRAESRISADPSHKPMWAECEKFARKKAARWRYMAWRICVAGHTDFSYRMPLVRMRAPRDGWLVLRGRRGHYAFCDEVRAYHLGTGTAWISQSCSDLVLREDPGHEGRVDAAKTDAARRPRVQTGRLPPEQLQELTWVLLLDGEAELTGRPRAVRRPVPEGLSLEWRAGEDVPFGIPGGVEGGSVWGNSGQTRITWSWFPPDRAEPLGGEFTWPESSSPEENHADHLVEALEKTFVEGCPQRPAPLDALDFTRPTTVNHVDAPEGVTKTQDGVLSALRDWKAPASCAGTPR